MARITVQRDNGTDNYSQDNAVRISLALSVEESQRFIQDLHGTSEKYSDVTKELSELMYPAHPISSYREHTRMPGGWE